MFDIDGYILLITKYSETDFNEEINRLSNLSITVSETCYSSSNKYTNFIKYDENLYNYPAYITIDGFDSKYEYALINKNDLEIIYIYLSYPDINNLVYNKYLKKNNREYGNIYSLNLYSIYSHSFDNGKSFAEYGDC